MSKAACCNVLAGSYMTLEDYNWSISYALEAADLYGPINYRWQQSMLKYAGTGYLSWENAKRAAFYFRRALKGADFALRATIYNQSGDIYRSAKRYEDALAAANQAQHDATSAVKSKQNIQGGLRQLMEALNKKYLALLVLKRLPLLVKEMPHKGSARYATWFFQLALSHLSESLGTGFLNWRLFSHPKKRLSSFVRCRGTSLFSPPRSARTRLAPSIGAAVPMSTAPSNYPPAC